MPWKAIAAHYDPNRRPAYLTGRYLTSPPFNAGGGVAIGSPLRGDAALVERAAGVKPLDVVNTVNMIC
ncbi:hypothetical protein KCP73_04670 [Salmonella enterica subsp. enterica]|nr:hypothetical protein KCP73_04670 [Salmonella enterica subsp. enterica]